MYFKELEKSAEEKDQRTAPAEQDEATNDEWLRLYKPVDKSGREKV